MSHEELRADEERRARYAEAKALLLRACKMLEDVERIEDGKLPMNHKNAHGESVYYAGEWVRLY